MKLRLFNTLRGLGGLFGATLVGLLLIPGLALFAAPSASDISGGLEHPLFMPALLLSLRTSLVSLCLILVLGTPLAWWLSRPGGKLTRVVETIVELPVVVPPAVVGVALLETFGRRGTLGPLLDSLGLALPFTEWAVVLAQLVVAAPFFIQAGANAFREIQPDTLVVARSLGASPGAAFFEVALPTALPGLLVGAGLAWARALGEFGATLLFAGNLPGSTQTMPLAIFTAMESDLKLAVVFALVLGGVGVLLLLGLRNLPRLRGRGAFRETDR